MGWEKIRNYHRKRYDFAFTIVELLVVIAVIAILVAMTIVIYAGVTSKARDSVRLSDMRTIESLLAEYDIEHGNFPSSSGNGAGGWEVSNISPNQFLQSLKGLSSVSINTIPVDPTNDSKMYYKYFRYSAGNYGCDATKGDYYVVGIVDMESSNGTYSSSPGWSCPNRDWQVEFAWVTGGFQD